jgi:hypothetical protein
MDVTGRVRTVYERRTGTSKKSGKPWSCQHFKLETDDDDQFDVEVWGQRDLAELEGEKVRVVGEKVSEEYEGKTYEKFRVNTKPQVLGESRNDNGERHDPSEDSWRVHLMRATNLLAKCHQAARSADLNDGEDARTLFIECKRYIKDMPAKPINTEPGPTNDFSNQK